MRVGFLRAGVFRIAAALVVATSGVGLAAAMSSAAVARPAPVSFADLVEELSPAVVNISTTQKVEINNRFSGLQDRFPPDSPMGELFRRFQQERGADEADEEPITREATSLGSGFIISADGYVVTNNHVISAQDGKTVVDKITITLSDERKFDAVVVGRDPATDLALLKVKATGLPTVQWGDSRAVRVGDWLLAIGNPFGFGGSVTAGIVSALHRDLNAGSYDRFIQTDASINRGNSGGPVFNTEGQVMGIATAIVSPSGGNVGIGFAIPAEQARPVIEQLRSIGRVRRGWLGVEIMAIDEDQAEAFGFDKVQGAAVTRVQNGTPAEAAGVRSGDIIMKFDGKQVDRNQSLPEIVSETPIGKAVTMEVLRERKIVRLNVKVGEFPSGDELASVSEDAGMPAEEPRNVTKNSNLGLSLQPLTPEIRARLKLDSSLNAVVISGVNRRSDAAARGIRQGDLILAINQLPVATPQDAAKIVDAARKAGREKVVIFLQRGENRLNLPVKLQSE